MNIKQIECFNALAETCSISQAAEKVFITQPACSRIIASLEEELGCTLFIRSKLDPHLTPAGEMIYEKTKLIYENYEEIRTIAQKTVHGEIGSLRIGILSNGITRKTSEIFDLFKRTNPSIDLVIRECADSDIENELRNDRVDGAIVVHTPEYYGNDLDFLIYDTHPTCLYIHKDNPLANKETVSMNDLKKENFITWKKSSSQTANTIIMKCCLNAGFTPRIIAEADSLSSLLTYLRCNYGITIATGSIREVFYDPDVLCFPLPELERSNEMLVWKKKNPLPQLKAFRKCIQQVLMG